MNEITIAQNNLPANIEELSKFVIVGREKLIAVKAEIRAIERVRLAQEVRAQKLKEAQDISDVVLDAEVRIGELMGVVPKATKGTGANQHSKRAEFFPGEKFSKANNIQSTPKSQADATLFTSGGEAKQEQKNTVRKPKFETPKSKIDVVREAGFTPKQVFQFQQLANHPELVAAAKVEARQNDEIVTRSSVLEKIKQARREEKAAVLEARREENAEKVEALATPLEAVGLFQTIVIDPPWDWGDEGDVNQFGRAKPDYHTMSIDEIEQMPVGKIADENCHLYLWVTNRSLPKAFRLMEAWGFRYITCLTWVKPSFGMGNYFRGSTEQVLFGVKGSQPLKRRDVGTHFTAPRGDRHSSKPEEFYRLVESCSYGPYIDIFGRKGRENWSVWGENGC